MAKYRKKPIEVEAIQYDATKYREAAEWAKGLIGNKPSKIIEVAEDERIFISTAGGNMTAYHGDFIIFGLGDEFYSVPPEIFHASYEEVSP
ncbi:hypothetical protein C5G87_06955 [Paenibacillus peoriae]|uniref:hypothetical protein n=1 Tax=Paenibacillus peoriae TaxID=59893 RepID=UPI000CEC8717|nr:hypothetical protein [Paenibacillus peoriae]PPQ49107.1 hypothetical protein C5G87_06955 [Paenibacillus peoriae]